MEHQVWHWQYQTYERHRIRNASDADDLVFYVVANEVEDESTERVRV